MSQENVELWRASIEDEFSFRAGTSGIEVPFGKHAFVTTFRAGMVVHSKLYMSQSEALEAAGLRE